MTARPVQTGSDRQKAYLARRKSAQTALPSPWAWLGIKGAQRLLTQAYRTATWTNRHQTGEFSTEDLTDLEMRHAFVENLAQDFEDLLIAEAVSRADCWPGAPFYQSAPSRVGALAASVDAGWRPEYPQFKTPAANDHGYSQT